MRGGEIEFVAIESQLGGECRVRNPWEGGEVALFRGDQQTQSLSGSLLKFDSAKGERIVLVRSGTSPTRFRQSLPPTN